MSPTVSVIIPVFNGAHCIHMAVQSVLAQTYKDLEVIIIDDGSTDETKARLSPWIQAGKIHYFYQENKGLAAARNAGIRQARGKLLKFLDHDDFIFPEQIERQVLSLNDNPDNFISVTNYEVEFQNRNKKYIDIWFGDQNQLIRFIENNIGPVHAMLVPRKVIETVGGFDERLSACEDWDLWLRLLINGCTFLKINEIGCCYKIGDGLSSDGDNMFRQRCKVFEKLNKIMLPKLKQLDDSIVLQLLKNNFNLVHTCFARKIQVSSLLSETLTTSGMIYSLKGNTAMKLCSSLFGIKNVAFLSYWGSFMKDKNYPKTLLGMFWRDEKNYN